MTELTRRGVLKAGASVGLTAGVGLATADQAQAAMPVLRRGNSGTAVTKLQKMLADAGYWCGLPDGSFGYNTQQAVYAVQKAHSLSRTGVAGSIVWNKLFAKSRPYVKTQPREWRDWTTLHINLSRQLLMVVQGGKVRWTFNISSGNGDYYMFRGRKVRAVTPKGDFRVYFTDSQGNQSPPNGWREGDLGLMYRPQFFTTNIAVHGSGSVPPYPASHGCVRISPRGMDHLWATGQMKMGRRVWVY